MKNGTHNRNVFKQGNKGVRLPKQPIPVKVVKGAERATRP